MKDIQFKILENSNCQKFVSVIPTILVEILLISYGSELEKKFNTIHWMPFTEQSKMAN